MYEENNKFPNVTFESIVGNLKKNLFIEDEWSQLDLENQIFEWWPWNFKVTIDVQSQGEYVDGSGDNWIKLRATVDVGKCSEDLGQQLIEYIGLTFPFGSLTYAESSVKLSTSVIVNPLNHEILNWFRLAIMAMAAETVRFWNPEISEKGFQPTYEPHPVSGHRNGPDEMAQIFFYEETTALHPDLNTIEILRKNRDSLINLLKQFNYELILSDSDYLEFYSAGISISLFTESDSPWALRFGPGMRITAGPQRTLANLDANYVGQLNQKMQSSSEVEISNIKSAIWLESELFIPTYLPAAFIAQESHGKIEISISNFVSQVRNNAIYLSKILEKEMKTND